MGGLLPKSDPEILPGTMSGCIPGELPAENPREKTEDADRHGKVKTENGLCVQGENLSCAQAFFFWQSFSLRKGIIRRRSCSQAARSGTHQPSGVGLPEAGSEISTGMHRPRTTGQLTRNAGEYWRVDGESGWNQSVVVLVLFRAGIRKRCTLEPRLSAGQAQQEAGPDWPDTRRETGRPGTGRHSLLRREGARQRTIRREEQRQDTIRQRAVL